MQNLKFEQG